MFSCAGRTTFFGGILTDVGDLGVEVDGVLRNSPTCSSLTNFGVSLSGWGANCPSKLGGEAMQRWGNTVCSKP